MPKKILLPFDPETMAVKDLITCADHLRMLVLMHRTGCDPAGLLDTVTTVFEAQ